ncbi:hypothetical protein KY495_09530 [Massilia sp. PAMC28688]|uniref:hypothetical protein n=1 Tax=Massilia sp. PAMC28688 TaxID=2861283 RepID=UPI001C62DE59|nr:hypothetical protein [Massilia sp. PAMC28688]QYF95366.1 hypothetical protein KY495_09530 [Massilia sp. PAMC28688]
MKPRLLFKRACAVTGLLALVGIGLYAAVNRNDRPPSLVVHRLEAAMHALGSAAPADNGYIHMLALDVPPDRDVVAVGAGRAAWLAQWTAKDAREDSSFPDGLQAVSMEPAASYHALHQACRQLNRVCQDALAMDMSKTTAWLASQQWLHARYGTMLGTTAWREVPLAGEQIPLPRFSPGFEGQRLHLLHAWLQAREGNAEQVKTLLERDLVFWRMMQLSAANLLTKMMGTAGIQQHFQAASMIMHALPASQRSRAIPRSWGVAFSPEERSMTLAMAGEYTLVKGGYAEIAQKAQAGPWWRVLPFKVGAFQMQDSLNRYAGHTVAIADTLAVDFPQMQAASERARMLVPATRDQGFATYLYNPLGKMLIEVAVETASFVNYGLRVADLEAMRRAALLAAHLRATNVARADMPASMQASALRNPYSGQPFVWDAEKERLMVGGLAQPDPRREAIEY